MLVWGWRPMGAKFRYAPFPTREAALEAVWTFTEHERVEVGQMEYQPTGPGSGELDDVEIVERPCSQTGGTAK